MDKSDGSYSISYTPAEPGVYSVWVCVKAQHVQVTSLTVFAVIYNNTILMIDLRMC